MYIHIQSEPSGERRRHPSRLVAHVAERCPCDGGAWRLGESPVTRRPVKDKDVPIVGTTVTNAIARRVRTAIANMSRSYEAVPQNTAQRVVDGDVSIRFIDDLKPVAAPQSVLQASGMSPADIATALQTQRLVDIPGSDPVLMPIAGSMRAFEQNGVVYIPKDSSDPDLSIDLMHEVNHAMNLVTVDRSKDPKGFLWEKFKGEVRASYAADYRNEQGQSDRGNISMRLEKSIEHARQQADIRGWTSGPDWDPAFLVRIRSWVPDGNLDNRK